MRAEQKLASEAVSESPSGTDVTAAPGGGRSSTMPRHVDDGNALPGLPTSSATWEQMSGHFGPLFSEYPHQFNRDTASLTLLVVRRPWTWALVNFSGMVLQAVQHVPEEG